MRLDEEPKAARLGSNNPNISRQRTQGGERRRVAPIGLLEGSKRIVQLMDQVLLLLEKLVNVNQLRKINFLREIGRDLPQRRAEGHRPPRGANRKKFAVPSRPLPLPASTGRQIYEHNMV
jgi:hypothetical protein